MFIYIALLSALGTALQNTLMAKYARLGDSLSMSFWRSVCLMVSLSPLLLLVDRDNVFISVDMMLPICLAGLLSAISFWLFMQSFKYLPVGISTALRYGLNVLVISVVSWFLFKEELSGMSILFMCMLVLGGAMLSVFKNNFTHLDNDSYFGRLFVIISGILSGIAFTILADSARKGDPYLTGYIREVVILIAFFFLTLGRKLFFSIGVEPITNKGLLKIFLASSPTLLGTGGFMVASTLGPVGIVSAITISGMLIAAFLGVLLYHEYLKPMQYIGIILITIAVVGIKMLS